ncbi:MAG: hypothetical protein U0521_17475 [Anaerolineae bacterium]
MSFTDQPIPDHRGDRVPGRRADAAAGSRRRVRALARSERKPRCCAKRVSRWHGDVTDADAAPARAVAGSCSTPLPTLAGMSASGWSTSRDAKRDRRRSSGRR